MKRVFLFLITTVLALNSFAVQYYVDTKEVDFGSKIIFSVEFNENETLKRFSENFNDFEVLKSDTSENRIDFILLPLAEGKVAISSQNILFEHDNEEFEINTDTIEIFVNTVIEEGKEFSPAPLAPFFDITSKYSIYAISVLVLCVLIIIFLIIYFLVRKKIKIGLLEKIREKPHKKAMRELEELKLKNFIELNKQKEFCLELSSILRNYIEGRFSFYCAEMTTAEIERFYFENKDFIPEFQFIVKMFQKMDLVKFAKYSLDKENLDNMYDFTKDYVLKTREVEKDEI